MNIGEQLQELAGKHTGFDARLKELKCEFKVEDVQLQGKFFYLKFKNGQPSIDDFVDYIYFRIIDFCIPYSVRKRYKQLYDTTGDNRYWIELSDKARKLFIHAKNQCLTSGEPGELILFIILETVLKAPQIACKMYLKTSENMPVHGSDSIHVSYDNSASILNLYWGESKLYQQISTAMDEVCTSISGFITNEGTGAPRSRDIEIIKDHIVIEDGDLKEQLLKYFDPYESESNDISECFACFIGFDYTLLSRLEQLDQTRLVAHFEVEYKDRILSAVKLFSDKVKNNSLDQLKFEIFLLPFKSVAELRTKFFQKLGVVL